MALGRAECGVEYMPTGGEQDQVWPLMESSNMFGHYREREQRASTAATFARNAG